MKYLKSMNRVFFTCLLVFLVFLLSQCSRIVESDINYDLQDLTIEDFNFKSNNNTEVSIKLKNHHSRLRVKLNVFLYEDDEANLITQLFSDSIGEFNFDLIYQNHHNNVLFQFITHNDTINEIINVNQIDKFKSINITPETLEKDISSLLLSKKSVDTDKDGISDKLDEFPNDHKRACILYYPSKGMYNTLVFEDKWPMKGDFDMNDAVISFNIKNILNAQNLVKDIEFELLVRARGASYLNAFAISLKGIKEKNIKSIKLLYDNSIDNIIFEKGHKNELIIPIIKNMSTLLPISPTHNFYATARYDNRLHKKILVRLVLKHSRSLKSIKSPPYNPFIYRVDNRGLEVHLKGNKATDLVDKNFFGTMDDYTNLKKRWYQTKSGFPFAMEIPGLWGYPIESISISDAYSELDSWILSSGKNNKTWYQNSDTLKIKKIKL